MLHVYRKFQFFLLPYYSSWSRYPHSFYLKNCIHDDKRYGHVGFELKTQKSGVLDKSVAICGNRSMWQQRPAVTYMSWRRSVKVASLVRCCRSVMAMARGTTRFSIRRLHVFIHTEKCRIERTAGIGWNAWSLGIDQANLKNAGILWFYHRGYIRRSRTPPCLVA